MKILHLASNDKFIKFAYHSFENVYPGQNTVFILEHQSLKSQYTPHPAFTIIGYKDILRPAFVRKLTQYDLVIVHGLYPQFASVINRASSAVKFVWIGWGFDYFRLISTDDRDYYLPETLALINRTQAAKNLPARVRRMLERGCRKILGMDESSRIKAIEKCAAFAPVLEDDYKLIQKAGRVKKLPTFLDWNYGSLEEHWAKGFTGQYTDGNNILIGNSNTAENNHIDALNTLYKAKKDPQQNVFVPLSYGDGRLVPDILERGKALFGDDFHALQNFMPLEDYIQIIKSCGFVIMNHKRQQGIGTIVLMMHLGAKVFLQQDCPSYHFFKRHGAIVYTVQDLENNPDMIRERLSAEEIQTNHAMLDRFWSKRVIDHKTRQLVETLTRTSGNHYKKDQA